MKHVFSAIAFALVLAGCGEAGSSSGVADHAAHDDAPTEVVVQTADWDVFGTAFETETAVPVETVAAAPDRFADGPVRIVGTITEVCQGMGCWMTLQVPDGRNVRVVMPRDEHGNYVFTLDPTISGRKAVVEGTLAHSTLAEFEAPMHGGAHEDTHGDDGHHADAAEGAHHATDAESEMNTRELQLTASGVLVERSL